MRFRNGRPQTIGGWESLTLTLLTGVCRSIFPFTDNANTVTVGFGTHTNLQLYQGGMLYDITPTLALPPVALGASPIATTNTSATVVVSQPGHPYIVGDSIIISGATAVATVTINGTWAVTAVTANTWSFTAGSSANATATGGGSAVIVSPQRALAAGQIDGTGTSGYSTGAYGAGGYGLPSAAEYFPRTWSHGAWGQNLLSSPRAGTIYTWDNNTASVSTPLQNAPANVTFMLVAPMNGGYQVFALGCNEEASGVFNPMAIRHSGIRDNTEWNTDVNTTSREYILTGGGRIVGGRMCGANLLVWTNDSLFLGQFLGDLDQPWRFDRVGKNCGLIGPNAAVVVGQQAFWISPDRQFYRYAIGGQPQAVPCQIRDEFAENLAASQGDKVVASSTAEFSEVRFDYPDARDGAGYENSRQMILVVDGPDAGSWSRGDVARTAMVDAGPTDFPIGTTYAGNVYWHERGKSADGGQLSGFIETADAYLDENNVMEINGVWPDVQDQVGPMTIECITRYFPQDDEVTTGELTMAPGDQKVDFRANGRLARFRYAFNSAPANWRLGKFDVDVTPGGLR